MGATEDTLAYRCYKHDFSFQPSETDVKQTENLPIERPILSYCNKFPEQYGNQQLSNSRFCYFSAFVCNKNQVKQRQFLVKLFHPLTTVKTELIG
jgi:hypothetical protein